MVNNRIVASASIGILAGILAASVGQNKVIDFLLTFGASSGSTALIVGMSAESKSRQKIELAESEVQKINSELKKSKADFKEIQKKLVEVTGHYTTLHAQYKILESENQHDKNNLSKAEFQLSSLTAAMEEAKRQISELTYIKEGYETDWQQMEEEKAQAIAREIKQGIRKAQKEELERIWANADSDCQNFLKSAEDATEMMLIFKEKADGAKTVALSIAESARKFRDEKNKQIDALIEQIEIKNSRIGLLQQELNGDLIEPKYLKAGYQKDARIADDIARHIWSMLQIPLAVQGYKSHEDGSANAGYSYSRSQSSEALVSLLNRHSGDIAKALGIHAIISIQKHDLSDLVVISWRCERPKPITEDAFYRIVEPASACTKLIREAMNHKKGGKPTLRIMGATGEGKGIIAKVLLADWVVNESGEVWLSDPMDGSDEDRWEVPKAAKSSKEGGQLLKEYITEFKNRKDKKSDRNDIQVLGLFDEFDKEHPRDDKDLVKSIWTAIRHHNMKLILMGQSSEVGSNGWQWDEMKNCTCLFVGSGITTAIKHAKDLGLSRATANQLEVQNDQISNWLEAKNQGLDAANQYRVGLLVCGDKTRFIELPPAYKGVINNSVSSIVSRPWESLEDSDKPTLEPLKICPGCGYKLRKAGSKMRCENPGHTKDMGLKTFKLES